MDPPALARLFEEGADACGTEEEAPERGGEYHAEHRLAVFDQRDVDGEFAVAVNELTRTVERVDEPEAPPRRCLEAAGGRFLGDDRNVRPQLAERGRDERLGAGIPYTVPRNTYRTSDGRWVAVSTSAESVAERVMDLIGLGDDPRFGDFSGRVAHRDLIDERMAEWMAARTMEQVLAEFEAAHAAVAPVYDMADIAADPHFRARGSIVEVDGVPMPEVVARLSATPGRVRWAGRPLDADGEAIRREVDPDGSAAG